MAWNTLTADDVRNALSDAETTAVRNFAGTDKLPSMVNNIVSRARGAIRQHQALDAEGTVPDDIRDDVICIAIFRYLTLVPGLLTTEARTEAAKLAEARLKLIAEGKVSVEPAATEVFAANGSAAAWGSATEVPTRL
jgi:hypothetical protein